MDQRRGRTGESTMNITTRMIGQVLIIFTVGWLFVLPDIGAEEKVPATFTVIISDAPYPEYTLSRDLTREMCKRSNVELRILSLPVSRSIFEVDQGTYDAEAPRNRTVERNYSNIVRIPETLFTNDLVAFSKDANIQLAGWDSLKPYRVAYARGWKIYENNVRSAAEIEILDNVTALFKFLDAERTDLALASRFLGTKVIEELHLKHIRVVESPLASKKMFIYVNKKHSKLALKLAEILREMKRDGTYRGIYNNVLKPPR